MLLLLLVASITIPLGLDLYMPVPEDNPLTVEKIELGRRLFFDRRLSRDGSVSCATCHDPDRAFSAAPSVSIGVFGRQGRRNAPALINRGYGRAFFWDAPHSFSRRAGPQADSGPQRDGHDACRRCPPAWASRLTKSPARWRATFAPSSPAIHPTDIVWLRAIAICMSQVLSRFKLKPEGELSADKYWRSDRTVR